MDVSAIVLNKLLADRDIEVWSKLKLVFLDAAYSSLYSAVAKYYDTYSAIPSFDELELTLREGPALRTLATVRLADNPDISSEVAINALIDQYTQNETVKLLDKFVDKLPIYDSAEIKENLAAMVLTLDEKTLTTEGVYSMADIMLFQNDAELARDRVHLGFNNTFDSVLAGVARQEFILIGGTRGSGKSITCSNIQVAQYEMGNTCAYFTIEMIARETNQRNLAILANVPHGNIKKNTLTDAELLRLVEARAGMFLDAGDLVSEFKKTGDRFAFEARLVREKKLRQDNQMIIIDDRALTLTNLDLHLGKIKSKFGDKFTVAVVDYMNQIVVEGTSSQFDWQPQIVISKKLKELARKHDIVMISPYQIDATGEARFAKGILDAADIALIMEAHKKEDPGMTFTTTKIRGGGDLTCTSPIDWETLRISPISIDRPIASTSEDKEKKQGVKRASKKDKAEPSRQVDSDADIPWDV